MKEILELRINLNFSNLLFSEEEGKVIGNSVKIIEIANTDSRYSLIPVVSKQVREKYEKGFFYGWKIKRQYSNSELDSACLYHLIIKKVFEPAGEECGTKYDESTACPICGANATQQLPLKMKGGSLPKTDIAITIAGEIVVSEKFVKCIKKFGIKGAVLHPIEISAKESKYFQLQSSEDFEFSQNTRAGINPFNFSEEDGNEIYKCPLGHTIGLNLLSEIYLTESDLLFSNDLLQSRQKVGVRRGLLRQAPSLICSKKFRNMILSENLTGFNFEIAHID